MCRCRIYGKGRKTDMKGIEKGWQFNWCSGVCGLGNDFVLKINLKVKCGCREER